MIKTSKFLSSIKDAENLLMSFKLFKAKGSKGNGIYSSEFMKVSKKGSLIEIYNCARSNLDYDILLKDDSLIQFQFKNNELRYLYIQNPFKFITKEEYLFQLFTTEDLESFEKNSIDELIDENEYEQYLNELGLNSRSNYFRYDYSSAGYVPLVHSYSHIHIGLNENVRIPTSKILTPLKFTKFLIKNTYYEEWKKFIKNNDGFYDEIKRIKSECISINSDNWKKIEENELFLS